MKPDNAHAHPYLFQVTLILMTLYRVTFSTAQVFLIFQGCRRSDEVITDLGDGSDGKHNAVLRDWQEPRAPLWSKAFHLSTAILRKCLLATADPH